MIEDEKPSAIELGISEPKPAAEPTHTLMEGGPGPKIEAREKLPTPGIIVESVTSGAYHYAEGMLVRDKDGRPAQVVRAFLQETDWRPALNEKDPSIKEPQKHTDSMITIRYADGSEQTIKAEGAVYANSELAIKDAEEFSELSSIELRGHRYQIGELVQAGDSIGQLAAIYPGETVKLGVIAREIYGQAKSPHRFFLIESSQVDHIIHEENGAIKRNPDGTFFKPSLTEPGKITEI